MKVLSKITDIAELSSDSVYTHMYDKQCMKIL